MVMSESGRDFSRGASRKNRAMFVRPPKWHLGKPVKEEGREGS